MWRFLNGVCGVAGLGGLKTEPRAAIVLQRLEFQAVARRRLPGDGEPQARPFRFRRKLGIEYHPASPSCPENVSRARWINGANTSAFLAERRCAANGSSRPNSFTKSLVFSEMPAAVSAIF